MDVPGEGWRVPGPASGLVPDVSNGGSGMSGQV